VAGHFGWRGTVDRGGDGHSLEKVAMLDIIRSFFSSDPKSMSSGRLCAILLVLAHIFAVLFLVIHLKIVPADIIKLAEATSIVVLVVLVPTKAIEFLRELKNK
jgi:hypothetical protein